MMYLDISLFIPIFTVKSLFLKLPSRRGRMEGFRFNGDTPKPLVSIPKWINDLDDLEVPLIS